MAPTQQEEWWTAGDLAKAGDVVPPTARRWIDTGLVPGVRTKLGVRLVRRADAESFLRRRAERKATA